jgi:predicted ribosome quality control (RQC) complex YloA/Tae2 family protein
MFNHWFAIRNYWREVAPEVTGARITQAFTYEKNQCSFILLKDRDRLRVDYSGRSELPHCVVKHQLNIPRKKVAIFSDLEGQEITQIRMIPSDRTLDWQLSDGTHLYLEFFGGIPNIYHAADSGDILDAFKDYDRGSQLNFQDFSDIPYPLPPDWRKRLQHNFKENARKSIKNALVQSLPHWTSQLSREALARIGEAIDIPVEELHDQQLEQIIAAVENIYQELDGDECYISELPQTIFSLIDLTHKSVTWDHRLPILDGYPMYIGVYYKWKAFQSQHSNLVNRLGNRIEQLQRKIDKQEAEQNKWKDPETYRLYGDLLMAHAYDIEANQDSVTVEDIIQGSGKIEIPLNPELSIIENAQNFYERAKRADRGQSALQKQIDESKTELRTLQDLFEELQEVSRFSALEDILDTLESHGISTKERQPSGETEKRTPYIEFTSPDGWPVLVGRTSRDNDELTFHIAHKDDFWFHAENVPGSHVIAMPDNKRIDKPPKATLEFAAGLAAGFSQAKHSSVVPVVYTRRKYVTKPRDAGPGLVRYQYEDSVIVEPRRG